MDVAQTDRAHIVIVGGGLAGLCAGIRARQLGMDTLVLEQGSAERYPCNTRFTSGLFHLCGDDVRADAATLRARMRLATGDEAQPDLVEALARNLHRTLDWLKRLGVKFIKVGPDGLRANALAPPVPRRPGLHWQGRSGDVLLRTLEAAFVALGGRMHRGVRARTLRMQGVRCVGLEAVDAAGSRTYVAQAVVLTDGGFPADPELISEHLCARPDRLLQRNAGTARGDGIRMATAVGARLAGMHRFYGHLQHREAMTRDGLWPYPAVDVLATAGIALDGQGRRFCDEGGGGVFIANAIARLPDPLAATVWFDDAVWQGPARNWLLPPNPYLVRAGVAPRQAVDIPALALDMGLDPAAVQHSIAQYNAMLEGIPTSPDVPIRSTQRIQAWPLRRPPFHAVPVCAGITSTTGGIATDGQARVQRENGGLIEGLFAAGGCTGGLEGGGYTGYVGGLAKSSVFGMLAGESAANACRP